MGLAGHPPYIDLDAALDSGNLTNAWMAAHERSYIPLDQALKLTILMGLDASETGYEKAARRFLERFIREAKPTLVQVKKVADALAELPKRLGYAEPGESPEWALRDLAGQLERRRG